MPTNEERPARDVSVIDAACTPFGRFGGGLARTRPHDLAAPVVRSLLHRSPELDPARLADVRLGDGDAAGEDNPDVARTAAQLAGLQTSLPGTTVNRICGSPPEAGAAASPAPAAAGARRTACTAWAQVDPVRAARS